MSDVMISQTAKPPADGQSQRGARLALAAVRWLVVAAPMLVVAAVLVLMAWTYYIEQKYYQKPGYEAIAAFADIGTISGQHLGLVPLVMNNNPVGFDGQFFYFIALDPTQPIICAHQPPNCALDVAFGEVRAERLLYPYTAWLLTLGHPHAVPYALLAVNFVAILMTVWLVGRMAVDVGASRWLGAAAGLYSGEVLGFLRDLADPYAVMWVVVAVYLLRKERYLWSALAVAAALLTREQLVLTLPLLALPLLVGRRWRTLALSALIALGPFIAWQVVLRVIWGRWALSSGDTQGAGVAGGIVPLPFHGLWHERHQPEFGMMVAFAALPLIMAVAIAGLALWRSRGNGLRGLFADPVPPLVILYTLLLSLTSWILWQDMWTPGRLAALAVVLGVIVVARLRSPMLWGSYGTLVAISSLTALMLVNA